MISIVIGRHGLVGSALMKNDLLNKGTYGTGRRKIHPGGMDLFLDLLNPEGFTYPPEVDTVFLVAAVAKVVDCEANPQMTWRVNADAPVYLAGLAFAVLKYPFIVFISSDAVERAPNLNYSKQKAYVESFLLARGNSAVVRPSRITDADRFTDFLIDVAEAHKPGLIRWGVV